MGTDYRHFQWKRNLFYASKENELSAVPRKEIEAVEEATETKVVKSDGDENRRVYFLADGSKLVQTYDPDTDEFKVQSNDV